MTDPQILSRLDTKNSPVGVGTLSLVDESIMESIGATLPELESVRHYTIPAPCSWTWYVAIRILFMQPGHALFQDVPIVYGLGLYGRGSAETAALGRE